VSLINNIKIFPYVRRARLLLKHYGALKGTYASLSEIVDQDDVPTELRILAAIERETGYVLFPVQVATALLLNAGYLIEMATGEGKTLSAMMASALLSLSGKRVVIFTANTYLVSRDVDLFSSIFTSLGITSSAVQPEQSEQEKCTAYGMDVVYVTATQYALDYLHDNSVYLLNERVHAEQNKVLIIDEADQALLDDARVPVAITVDLGEISIDHRWFQRIQSRFIKDEHFTASQDGGRVITLSEVGYQLAEQVFLEKKLIKNRHELYTPDGNSYVDALIQSLCANYLVFVGKDYLVDAGAIAFVDQKTGRVAVGSRFRNGLHQAVQAKENVARTKNQWVAGNVTLSGLLSLFDRVSGMSGTLYEQRQELNRHYQLSVVKVPRNIPSKRIDHHDLIFYTQEKKYDYMLLQVAEAYAQDRPVLIGVSSTATANHVSALLTTSDIPHALLSAENPFEESEVLARAGELGQITVITNIAGRGTDIKLGGGDSSKKSMILEKGGLLLLGVERNVLRRYDNQLLGRVGRQGDQGETQFLISLDDSLLTDFSDNTFLKTIWERLGLTETPASNRLISRSLTRIQTKLDAHYADMRKSLNKFAHTGKLQRDGYYDFRDRVLSSDKIGFMEKLYDIVVERALIKSHAQSLPNEEAVFEETLERFFLTKQVSCYVRSESIEQNFSRYKVIWMSEINTFYRDNGVLMSRLIFAAMDKQWAIHLSEAQNIQTNSGLGAYAQDKPLLVYEREMLSAYESLLTNISQHVLTMVKMRNDYITVEVSELSDVEYRHFYQQVMKDFSLTPMPFEKIGI
jgi:preprotein translocase subunit SecA